MDYYPELHCLGFVFMSGVDSTLLYAALSTTWVVEKWDVMVEKDTFLITCWASTCPTGGGARHHPMEGILSKAVRARLFFLPADVQYLGQHP